MADKKRSVSSDGKQNKKQKAVSTTSRRKKINSNQLELLITIVNRQKAEFFVDLLQSFEVNVQLSIRAQGTANERMLHILGLENNPKTAIFSIIRADKVQDALATLEEKFNTIKNGKGIAYTVPLSSVIGVATFGFLSNNQKTVKEEKK